MLRVAPDHAMAAPAGAAPDAGSSAITISVQDEQGGLEIELDDGRWMPIEPRPGMLLVSVGDALARWTRGHYRALPHRIQAQHGPRYVMPFQYRTARALRPLAA